MTPRLEPCLEPLLVRGTMTETSAGIWRLRVVVGYRPDGQPRQASRTVHGTLRTAQSDLAKVLTDAEGGKLPLTGNMILVAFLDRWIEHLWVHRQPDATRKCALRSKRYKPEFGSVRLYKLRSYDPGGPWDHRPHQAHRRGRRQVLHLQQDQRLPRPQVRPDPLDRNPPSSSQISAPRPPPRPATTPAVVAPPTALPASSGAWRELDEADDAGGTGVTGSSSRPARPVGSVMPPIEVRERSISGPRRLRLSSMPAVRSSRTSSPVPRSSLALSPARTHRGVRPLPRAGISSARPD